MGAFSNWIAKFTDLVNLGKLMTDGGPGAILAIAMLLAIATYKGIPFFPETYKAPPPAGERYRPSDANGPEPHKASEKPAEAHAPATGRAEQKRSGELGELDKKIADLQDEIAYCTGQQARVRPEIADLQTKIKTRQELEAVLQKAGAERAGKDWLSPVSVEEKRTKLQGETKKDLTLSTQKEAESAQLEKWIAARQDDLTRAIERRKTLEAKTVNNVVDLMGWILDHAIGLLLVGYVLGTILSPLNRALLLWNWGRDDEQLADLPDNEPEATNKLVESIRSHEPEARLRELQGAKKELNELKRSEESLKYLQIQRAKKNLRALQTDTLRDVLGAKPATNKVVEDKKLLFAASAQMAGLTIARSYDVTLEFPPNYYVGLTVISKEELDWLVTKYYRWAELSINLAIPILFLGISITYHQMKLQGPSPLMSWLPLVLAIASSFSLGHMGPSLHKRYKAYVSAFINGRLQHIQDQKAATDAAQKVEGELRVQMEELTKKIKQLLDKCPPKEEKQGPQSGPK